MALRLAPGRDMSRLPTRLGPVAPKPRLLLPKLEVEGRLTEEGRLALRLLLARLPPCLFTCCRAFVCRLDKESPRALPPNLLAVARSE